MTTIVTRASKGGRLSFTDMDNNLINLKNTADAAAPSANPTFTGTVSGVTAAMVGLGNVNNTSDANKPVSTAQAAAIAVETSRAGAAEALLAPIANPTFTGTVSGVTAAMVGLGNVNNTSDANKPVSTAQAAAIAVETSRAQAAEALLAPQATTYTKTETDAKIQAVVGAAPAALDTLVEIATQLASDESAAAALTTAVSLKAPLASPTFTGTVSGITAAMVGLGNVNNTSDLAKPVSTATTTAIGVETTRATAAEGTLTTNLNAEISRAQAAEALLAPKASPTFTGTVSGVTAAMVGLGNVTNVAQLPNTQTLAITGDATAAATGLSTGTIAVTLATVTDSGTGSFKKITTNSKGLVTGTAAVAQADITGLLGAGSITNTMLANAAVANLSGTNTGDETATTIKTKLGITTLSGSNTGDQTTITGNAGTATKLAAPVNINGVAFDGSAAITINAVDATARVASSLLGAVSGVATLDASGKLATAQIPAALVGALQYQGVWNASTNSPALVSSTGTKGQYYKVSVAGTTTIDQKGQ